MDLYALLLYAVSLIVPVAAVLTGVASWRFYVEDARRREE